MFRTQNNEILFDIFIHVYYCTLLIFNSTFSPISLLIPLPNLFQNISPADYMSDIYSTYERKPRYQPLLFAVIIGNILETLTHRLHI